MPSCVSSLRKRIDNAGGETFSTRAAALRDSQRESVTARRRSSIAIIQLSLRIDDNALNHSFIISK
ncbi:hypothetical protein KPSA1_02495 [Pseudomonas syringae pv. actinidiae]|uniref:Uncharacterized protein n=1 Tax=Pseudomonas syringae pv. actinidiae TaxID=103796 RepID=A0A2V0Q8P7_PSESF|nr:hypothetical protein KPSA1_02495 [Pseudomonas syringae pv. actinidiae]GBH18665.1 hypothetical protein KPSA3_04654 [Pseudomonas syringae pv. actinidiae]